MGAGDRRRLLASADSLFGQFSEDRFLTKRIPCPNDSSGFALCTRVRGYPRRMSVYLDGLPAPAGAAMLDHYAPSDLYQVEVYPSLGQIHLFTPHYVEWLAKSGRRPPPICIVRG